MPTASASPPSVITLIVSPSALSTTSDVAIDSGIEIHTISVDRHDPRNSRIINPVSAAAMHASRTTSLIDDRTKIDWSNSGVIFKLPSPAVNCGIIAFVRDTISKVDVSPFFSTSSSAPRLPFTRTIFVCSANPMWTCATSFTYTTAPFAARIGISFSADKSSGLEFVFITYSRSPIRSVPAGKIRFCCEIACDTSLADR